MKKLLFSLMLASFVISLQAQVTFNKAYHNAVQYTPGFVTSLNGHYYHVTNSDSGSIFYAHSASGLIEKRVALGYTSNFGIKTLENRFLLAGSVRMCDVFMPPYSDVLLNVDTAGNVLASFTHTYSSVDRVKAVVQKADSSYLVFTDSLLLHCSKNLQLLSSTSLPFKGVTSALLLPNANVLVSANPGLIEITPAGLTVSSSVAPLQKKLMLFGGQKILALEALSGKLSKFSANFQLIGSLTSTTSAFVDFTCDKDTIYAISENRYFMCDTLFSTLSQKTNTTTGLSQTLIHKDGPLIQVVSESNAHSYSYFNSGYVTYVTLNVFDRFAGTSFKEDIELSSFEPDTLYSTSQGYLNLIAKVKVTNRGNGPLRSFKLNCYLYSNVACGRNYYQQTFTDLNLLPGESLTLTTNPLQKPSTFTIKNYCIFTSLPNGEADTYTENNMICHSFNTVGIYERTSLDENFNVFPNPVSKTLNITSEFKLESIEILNLMGQPVSKVNIEGNEAEVGTSELSAGVYLIKITTGRGVAIKKIIKQ